MNSPRTLLKLTTWPWLLLLGILAGCSDQADQAAQIKTLESRIGALEAVLAKSKPAASAPRLGNIMGTVQLRHVKLWFAGEQANWPLAAYELHELEEDFEDVEKFHPIHGSARLPLGQMAVELPKPAFTVLKQAIKAGDRAGFSTGFDALTASCNICHASANLAFNVIQRPATPFLSNQDFTPRPGSSAALQERSIEAVGIKAIQR